jgi:carboxypeptidase PM20D1
MRRLLAAATILLLMLAAVLMVRTLRVASRQPALPPPPALALDVDAAARRLGAAVRARTISYDDRRADSAAAFVELRALLQRSFPRVHERLERELVRENSLLYTWHGSDPTLAPALLLAHQDVVPVAPGTQSEWLQDPFGGAIADGYVWGRGTWDDKGNLMAMLEAVEALAAQGYQPRRTLYLGFGDDEEIGGAQGAAQIAALLRARRVRLAYVLDEGLLVTEGIIPGVAAPVALIGTAEKGYLTMALRAEAQSGHSSMPPARTAIGALSRALVRLEDAPAPAQLQGVPRQMLETLAPEMPLAQRLLFANLWLFGPLVRGELDKQPSGRASLRTTQAPTTLRAGDKENVLPGRAEAQVNFRLLPGDTVAQVLERSRVAVDDPQIALSATAQAWDPAPASSTDDPAYRLLAQAIRETFAGAIVAPGLMLGATDSRRYLDLTAQTYRFTPVRATEQDLARFHGSNERIALANYAQMIRFYHRLIELTTAH